MSHKEYKFLAAAGVLVGTVGGAAMLADAKAGGAVAVGTGIVLVVAAVVGFLWNDQ